MRQRDGREKARQFGSATNSLANRKLYPAARQCFPGTSDAQAGSHDSARPLSDSAMAAPKIMIAGEPARRSTVRRPAPAVEQAWDLLAWLGLAFASIGMMDILLTWVPTGFGNPEWEFGTVSSSMNGLPLPAMGLSFILASGISRGRSWQIRGAAIAFAFVALALLAVGVLYLTVVPMAFQNVNNDLVRTGLLKAVAKAAVLLVLYPVLFASLAVVGWRRLRST